MLIILFFPDIFKEEINRKLTSIYGINNESYCINNYFFYSE